MSGGGKPLPDTVFGRRTGPCGEGPLSTGTSPAHWRLPWTPTAHTTPSGPVRSPAADFSRPPVSPPPPPPWRPQVPPPPPRLPPAPRRPRPPPRRGGRRPPRLGRPLPLGHPLPDRRHRWFRDAL